MILGAVCARAGSEGLPGKNERRLGGRSLIEIALDKAHAFARATALCTDIPDPPSGTHYELPRPPDLCGPRVSKWTVWRFIASWAWTDWRNADRPVLLDIDVTRPLTTVLDVLGTVRSHESQDAPVTLAVYESEKHPAFDLYRPDDRYGLFPCDGDGSVAARQELGPVYGYGGICMVDRGALMENDGWWDDRVNYHVIPRSHALDVDDELDWQIVEDQWARHKRAGGMAHVPFGRCVA